MVIGAKLSGRPWHQKKEKQDCITTLDVPWLQLVEIDVADDIKVYLFGGDLLAEVVVEELLLRGVETEPRRDARLPIHRDTHCSLSTVRRRLALARIE